MNKSIIEKAIKINAIPGKVWKVFTDPVVTRQMGGEYVTDWKVGSPFRWKGLDGKLYTNGIILQLESKALLKHNLFDPEEKASVRSIITYRFQYNNGNTILLAREDLIHDMTNSEYQEAMEGWDAALLAVKEIAEKLQME